MQSLRVDEDKIGALWYRAGNQVSSVSHNYPSNVYEMAGHLLWQTQPVKLLEKSVAQLLVPFLLV